VLKNYYKIKNNMKDTLGDSQLERVRLMEKKLTFLILSKRYFLLDMQSDVIRGTYLKIVRVILNNFGKVI